MRILGRQFVMGRTIEEALDARRGRPRSAAIAIPTTCWARRRAPPADAERYFARLSRTPSPRSARAAAGRDVVDGARHLGQALGAASALRGRRSASACWRELRAARCRRSRGAPRRPASASPSMPRRPSGSTSRSTSSRRVAARSGARRLGRPRPRRPGLSEARAAADRLARRPRAPRTAGASWCGWSRAPIGTARSSARQERGLAGYPVFTRKVATDVSYLACAKRLLADARRLLSAVRHPQRAHRRGRARAGRQPRAISSSSACTAWARRSTSRSSAPTSCGCPAASMRRSAATRICWPISCAGCWRTAPTPPSSTASSTRRLPIEEIVADPVARLRRARRTSRIRASRCRAISTAPERRNSRGIDLTDPRRARAARRAR